jgi:hypothetical protein
MIANSTSAHAKHRRSGERQPEEHLAAAAEAGQVRYSPVHEDEAGCVEYQHPDHGTEKKPSGCDERREKQAQARFERTDHPSRASEGGDGTDRGSRGVCA